MNAVLIAEHQQTPPSIEVFYSEIRIQSIVSALSLPIINPSVSLHDPFAGVTGKQTILKTTRQGKADTSHQAHRGPTDRRRNPAD